jgi:hypothetical protein
MHVVIYMNLQWKIILSTCLAIAICFTMASAAFESSFTTISFDKSSATAFADAKASDIMNYPTDWVSFGRGLFEGSASIQKPDPPDDSADSTQSLTRSPRFFPTPLPTRTFPLPLPITGVPVAITESEALEIASTHGITDNPLCPGITATREREFIDGKMMQVWRVSGKCGKIVSLDMYSGELVKTDYIKCMCYDPSTRRS